MRELWWLLRGSVRVRITGADPERTLRLLSEKVRMEEIRRPSHLEVELSVELDDLKTVTEAVERTGDRLEVLKRQGVPEWIGSCRTVPVITLTVFLLVLLSGWIPTRILFFRVEGALSIPERLILEEAADCGLYFGVSRGDVRSEQIKNRLLEAIPELGWVGVNTNGCVATIAVRERQLSPEESQPAPGNIVASIDGMVTSVTVTSGTPACRIGDGVRAGDILISGYTDLGLCTHVEPADGEIYAMTRRENTAVIPAETGIRLAEGDSVRKIAVLIGKYRINFYSDSGILYTGCDKMTKIRILRLPGGWTLPVALVVEQYTLAETVREIRPESGARAALEEASLAQMEGNMIAGEILRRETVMESGEGIYRLKSLCECREMIGRRSSGILTEGDTNDDRQNGERGAG